MRIARLIFTGSIAALAVLTAPALAKNSNTQKVDDTSASSSPASPTCRAYQQAADGSWTSLPCQENGSDETIHSFSMLWIASLALAMTLSLENTPRRGLVSTQPDTDSRRLTGARQPARAGSR